MARRWRRLVAVGVALILSIACRTASDAGGRQPLPPPLPGTTHFSEYEPEHPYKPSKEEGVFERTDFTASSLKGYDVEVRDFLVSPERPKAPVPLPGAALLEVRQGSGTAKVHGKEIALRPGVVFMVGRGEPLFVTASDEPLALRTWIVIMEEAR
jgi:hypothetical protein